MPESGPVAADSVVADSSRLLRETRVRREDVLRVLLGAIAGLAVFFSYGFDHCLSPRYIGWLLHDTQGGPQNWYYDPGTSYVGWQYFRHAPWQFPPGTNRAYGMEFASSIVFSDSCPVFSFLFKPFSHWLGSNFQYVGIWVLTCFLMQGIFGALLASKVVRGALPTFLVAAFFAFSPVLQERAWTEYFEMAHWLVLWGIYLYFTERSGPLRWEWIFPVALAVNSHFYFVPMVLSLWAADVVKSLFRRTLTFRFFLAEGALVAATLFACMWLAGYFLVSVKDTQTNAFGIFAANLLGFIDPWGNSQFLRPQPHSPVWKGEGYCYLGLGMILLCAIALFEWIRRPVQWKAVLYALPVMVVLAGLAAFSLSNTVALGSHVVLKLHDFWGRLGPIFRASGRMTWPAFYGIYLGAFYLALRGMRPWKTSVVLAVLLSIQIADLWPNYLTMHDRYATTRTWTFPLTDGFWRPAMRRYKQVVVVPSGHILPYIPLAYLGAKYQIPTNAAYINRYPGTDVIGPISDARLQNLLNDRLDPDTLYVIPETGRFCTIARGLSKEHGIGRINQYNIIAPDWFAGGKPAGAGSVVPAGGAAAQALLARIGGA